MLSVLRKNYSLRPVLLFANMDVSRHILVVDTSILVKSNMGQREYSICWMKLYNISAQFMVHWVFLYYIIKWAVSSHVWQIRQGSMQPQGKQSITTICRTKGFTLSYSNELSTCIAKWLTCHELQDVHLLEHVEHSRFFAMT
jgi:hypothetical protein